MKKRKKDEYEKHACEFKNEADCEEELDADGLDSENAEEAHFEKYE